MRKIIGIGETILDILFKDNCAATSVPGGSTFNSMVSLGRVGVPACFLSEIGDDKVGDIVRMFLVDNGVDDSYLTIYPDCKSPISLAFLDGHNNATYSFYKEPFGRRTDWEHPTIERDDIVLFGSYYAINPTMRYKVAALLDEARRVGAIIYYDVNFRRNHAGEAIKLMGSVIENLEKDVEYIRMRFFNLIKENNRVHFASDFLGEISCFVVSDISGRRPDES